MAQVYRILANASWLAGLLSLVAAFVVKLLHLEARVTFNSHTAFLVAGTFFLCALATREMQRP